MKIVLKILLTSTLSGLIFSGSMGQVKSVYEDMSLDEILNVDVVVTASKKPEDLFEAPLSTTIIKKEDIARSGATSIPEALRLSPGLIVREITPGNFDVHVRGYDDITKNAYLTLPLNTMTLVMIDNRIVYSYFTGGTFWETFPVDVNDVEQIEIIRGPAAALYGPNAVTGVINIITSRADKKGFGTYGNVNAGNNFAKDGYANVGYNWNDKTQLSFSGNLSERHRYNTDYFDPFIQKYVPINELQNIMLNAERDVNTHDTWTFADYQKELGADYNEDLSLRKMGGNIFFDHQFSGHSNVKLAMGGQNSQSQKTGFLNYATPISQIKSKSYYFDSKIRMKDFSGQFNMNSGEYLSNYKFNSYKFTDIDGSVEYFKQFKKISIRPGLGFKNSTYNSPITYDQPFSLSTLNFQFKDEPRKIYSYSASLLYEWKPFQKLRVIGAVRTDKFNVNNKFSSNYEIATTYRINKNNLLRYVYSKSNRSPFIFDTYLNSSFNLYLHHVGNTYEVDAPITFNIEAEKNLKFPRNINQEIGWRTMIGQKLNLDFELFYSKADNFIVSNVYRELNILHLIDLEDKVDTVLAATGTADLKFENFNIKTEQYGFGFSINYNPTEKITTKFFGNWQKTIYTGLTEIDFKVTGIEFGELKEDRTRTMDVYYATNATPWSEKLTPSFYGGFIINYSCTNRWKFSTNGYFYSNQQFKDYDYHNIMSDFTQVYNDNFININANLVLDAKTSYRINKNLTASGSIKNMLGKHREFGYADQIGTMYLIGLHWNY